MSEGQEEFSPLILIPQKERDALVEFGQRCYAFAAVCRDRVTNLETYRIEADSQIKSLTEENVSLKKKPSFGSFIPVAFLIGLVTGILVK